jgi:hypothetical protein
MFGTYALTHEDPDGVVVSGHTKAAVEEKFIWFVKVVRRDVVRCGQIAQRDALPPAALPVDVYGTTALTELHEMAIIGHRLRIAYNHASVGDQYSEIVGDEVTRHRRGASRVIFCTSKYAAGINLENFNHVFIEGGKKRCPHSRLCRPSELAQMASRGARWGIGILFCLVFIFDQQFEEPYFLPDINRKKPCMDKLVSGQCQQSSEVMSSHLKSLRGTWVARFSRQCWNSSTG